MYVFYLGLRSEWETHLNIQKGKYEIIHKVHYRDDHLGRVYSIC